MPPLPNPYADIPRLQAVATTLKITVEAANQAFAQYVPRDAIEADMVEQILLTRARLNAATARVLQPDLSPAIAARIDRTINTMSRHLQVLLERLEHRQNRPTWNLPQQYWRLDPVRQVGPVTEENILPAQPAPEFAQDEIPASQPIIVPAARQPIIVPAARHPTIVPAARWTDPPGMGGDALARFASQRLTPDQSARDAWSTAEHAAAPSPMNRKQRRDRERQAA
jgi:hypothetical protein